MLESDTKAVVVGSGQAERNVDTAEETPEPVSAYVRCLSKVPFIGQILITLSTAAHASNAALIKSLGGVDTFQVLYIKAFLFKA